MLASDVPIGTKRYDGKEVRKILDALRNKDIDFYERTKHCINGGVQYLRSFGATESGDGWSSVKDKCPTDNRELFNGELHPTVNGVNYYRGIAVPAKGGVILLYAPWMQPWIRKQRRETFDVRVRGDVSDEEVLNVIEAYSERMGKHIDRVLSRKANVERLDLVPYLFKE